jgi:hypothetical protein
MFCRRCSNLARRCANNVSPGDGRGVWCTKLALAVVVVLSFSACPKGTPSSSIATCVEHTAVMAYSSKNQEYGNPWVETDTFAFHRSGASEIHVALVGGADDVEKAKARIESRLIVVKKAVEVCAENANIQPLDLHMVYTFRERKDGLMRDVVLWHQGKFDLPPTDTGQDFWAWLSIQQK